MSNTVKNKNAAKGLSLADSPNALLVQPSDYAGEHQFSGGSDGQLLVRDSGQTDGANWTSSPTLTGISTTEVDGIAASTTDGEVLQNVTPATAGVPVQMSPRIRFASTVWDTVALISKVVSGWIEVKPTSAASPVGVMLFGFRIDVGGNVFPATLDSIGNFTAVGQVIGSSLLATATQFVGWIGRANMQAPQVGQIDVQNSSATIGAKLKVDALPTIASGFGTSPAITAGSTPFAGQVDVGTGGVATSGVINFNGTAFNVAPFVVAMNQTTGAVLKAVATTTQLTITGNAAFNANDKINWICIGPRG